MDRSDYKAQRELKAVPMSVLLKMIEAHIKTCEHPDKAGSILEEIELRLA